MSQAYNKFSCIHRDIGCPNFVRSFCLLLFLACDLTIRRLGVAERGRVLAVYRKPPTRPLLHREESGLIDPQSHGRHPGRTKRAGPQSAGASYGPASHIAVPVVRCGFVGYSRMDVVVYRSRLSAAEGNLEQVDHTSVMTWVDGEAALGGSM